MIDLRFTEKKEDLKKYLILLALSPLAIFSFILITFGIQNLQNSDIFIAYISLIGFTLPFLISKILLKASFFSLKTLYSFLIYFLLYFVSFLISQLGFVSIPQIYILFGIATVLAWNFLLYKLIKEYPIDYIDDLVTNIMCVIIPIAIYIVAMYFVRQYLALHSTDILVHKTVINGMSNPSVFSFMPANYSTTFTDQGYPIAMYHSIVYWFINSFGVNFVKFAYIIDLAFSFITSIVIFKLVYSNFKKIIPSLAVVALTLLTFENLAYTTQFYIPQTFTYLLFLIILVSGKLKLKTLALSIAILIVSHFFIGAYLSVILIVKYLILDKKIFYTNNRFPLKWVLIIILSFVFALSFAGFSVEKSLQQGMVDWVGMTTNPEFAEKTQNLVELWGINIIIVIAATVSFLLKQKNKSLETLAFILASASFGAYYLGPAFASKFLLGMGLSAAILIISWIYNIKGIHYIARAFILVILSISFAFSYLIAYSQPLPFLTQQDGTVSALVKKDIQLINFWQENSPNCTLISDPQTQQSIHTFSNGNTARGYYLTLDARSRIISFMTAPTQQKLDRLTTIEELEGNDGPICFAVTSRLKELVEKNQIWTQNIFNYKIDHDTTLDGQDKAILFLENNQYKKVYQDSFSTVFLIRN